MSDIVPISYLRPDLTGELPTHKVDNRLYTIFKTGTTTIDLDSVIFKDGLVITQIGTTNKLLYLGTDYDILDSDIDYTAISKMKTYQSDFDKTLCKSITFYNPTDTTFQINLAYQQLYPVQSRTAYYNGQPLDVTPELIFDMLQQIDYLLLRTSKVSDVTAVTDADVKIFEEDPFMENSDNDVTDEEYDVNTASGKLFIHPIGGSFFEEGLVIKHPASNTTLQLGTDYRLFGLNIRKTILTNRTRPIYDYIVFATALVGTVTLDYHAFGGDPTIANIHELKDQFLNIIGFLNEAKFITDSTLSGTATIQAMLTRITSLEAEMRKLLTGGSPSYGDCSTGKSLAIKITAPDTALHWWTIASLYKVDGASDVTVCDRMKFRLQTLYSKFMFDANVAVNLNNPAKTRLQVDTEGDIYPRGYIPFQDYSGVNTLVRPQFRIVWNSNATEASGCYLQFGMELKQMTTETVVIEDYSGLESCWKLIEDPLVSIAPQDDLLTLPNTTMVWDMTNANSQVESTLMPFRYGHLVWAGSQPLNRPTGDWSHYPITDHFLDNYVDFTRIKKARLELMEVGGYAFPIDIEFIPGLDVLNGFTNFNYGQKNASIHMKIWRDTDTDKINFDLDYAIEAGAESTQLDLRGLVIFV